jgi:serine/threonine-protein kinase
VIAAIGLGGPPRSGDIPAGYVTIAGIDPATARVVRLDLSKPIPIAGTLPPSAAQADSVKLTFKASDVELGSAAAGIVPTPDGTFSATFKTSGGRYLLAGKAAAQLEFLRGEGTAAHQNFVVRSTQWALATIPAIVSLVGMWALLNRIGWIWRAMYKGRRRRFGPLRLAGLGALAGAVLVGIAWLVLARAPMLSTVVVCAALGAAAGLCGGMAALYLGDQRRARRRSKPSETPTKPALQDAPAG